MLWLMIIALFLSLPVVTCDRFDLWSSVLFACGKLELHINYMSKSICVEFYYLCICEVKVVTYKGLVSC